MPIYYQCQLKLFVTTRHYCDFIVWSNSEVHVERITQDEALIQSAIPKAIKFWRMCILPELMGKWYTYIKQTSIPSHEQITQEEEEDSGKCGAFANS